MPIYISNGIIISGLKGMLNQIFQSGIWLMILLIYKQQNYISKSKAFVITIIIWFDDPISVILGYFHWDI